MLARLGTRIGAIFRATAPDPFVIAIVLTGVAFVASAGWLVGSEGLGPIGAARRTVHLWEGGLWNLLRFGMQMCLILVTGHALASAPVVARGIRGVARFAVGRGGRGAVAVVSLVAMGAALVNWGFGLIVGAILAREVTRTLREGGVGEGAVPAGLIAAAGYTGLLVWHGGLSGSAPLAAASAAQQVELLGPELGRAVGAIGVRETILSGLNAVVTGGLVVLVPIGLMLMAPARGRTAGEPAAGEPGPGPVEAQAVTIDEADAVGPIPRWLERTPVVGWIVAVPAAVWLAGAFADRGFAALDLNTANLAFFAVGLVLHGGAGSYARAVEEAARGCAGIIVQFPLYAGIMGMIGGSGLAAAISAWMVGASGGGAGGLGVAKFASAGLVNLFVPSGGGQWAIQGPIGLAAAMDAGVDPARIVLAVSYGDQLTNMLQPFWALPLLAITGAKAREVVAYTAVVMLAAGAWMAACLLIL